MRACGTSSSAPESPSVLRGRTLSSEGGHGRGEDEERVLETLPPRAAQPRSRQLGREMLLLKQSGLCRKASPSSCPPTPPCPKDVSMVTSSRQKQDWNSRWELHSTGWPVQLLGFGGNCVGAEGWAWEGTEGAHEHRVPVEPQ